MNYHLHLKGYVGGWDFDASYVDYILSKNPDKEVSVLIDSPGGLLSTALSISSAFQRHGHVHAHFVGMNASAATIASMGAQRITMDRSAMYLVHQCSQQFFKWGSLNANDMQSLIQSLEKQKTDLDKMDANVAMMYARRCKKKSADLLALMQAGGWLSAEEALAWGFIDEITNFEDETAPVLTDAMVSHFTAHGIPLPTLPHAQDDHSLLQRFFQSFAAFFKSQNDTPMNKTYKLICEALAIDTIASTNGTATLTNTQLDTLELALEAKQKMITDLTSQFDKLSQQNTALEQEKAELQAKLSTLPAASSTTVVENTPSPAEKSDYARFIDTTRSAQSLYDSLP